MESGGQGSDLKPRFTGGSKHSRGRSSCPTGWADLENSILYSPGQSLVLHSSQDKPMKTMFFMKIPCADPLPTVGTMRWCRGSALQGEAPSGTRGCILVWARCSGQVKSPSSPVDLPAPQKLLARLLVSGSPTLCLGLAEATSCGTSPSSSSFPEPQERGRSWTLGTTGPSRSLVSLSGKCARDSVLGLALRFLCSAFEQPRSIPRTVAQSPTVG